LALLKNSVASMTLFEWVVSLATLPALSIVILHLHEHRASFPVDLDDSMIESNEKGIGFLKTVMSMKRRQNGLAQASMEFGLGAMMRQATGRDLE
jgi:hypothetical protein